MKIIEGVLKRIEVIDFSPKDRLLELQVIFTDGKEKHFFKKFELRNPEKLADEIIKELKVQIKKAAMTTDTIDVLSNIVVTKVKDEEQSYEKIVHFLDGIKIKTDSMLSDGTTPYVKIVDRINKTGINF